MRLVLALALLFSLVDAAQAAKNPIATVLAKLPECDPGAFAYFAGLGQGISHANAVLSSEGRKLLYCPPRELLIGTGEYETILREFLRSHAKEDDTEVSLMLIFALRDKYPCRP